MKSVHIGALAALLVTAGAPCTFAQTPSPDPNAASSPPQCEVTGSKALDSTVANGSAPGDASSPHQQETPQVSVHS